ncbi:ADP compounds hydrolase NudE [Aeromonas sp. NJAU223]|uniref:ADP compounds hydrolase NudE n=1 Tax=Aeromonas sp. NJAU223 TaxID=3115650 RepID=UPI003DA7A818
MSDSHKCNPVHLSVDALAQDKVKPTILKAEIVAESRLFKVESLHLQFSNGEERVYERMRGGNRGAVMVVPLLDAHTLLLVREYAAGTHSYELGFPKGLIDPGENAFEAGNRELMEEAGFGARDLVSLKQVSLAPGYFSSRMDILLARELYPELRVGDEPEPLEVIPWPLDQIDELLARPDFTESRSISALLLARKWLAEQGNERP